MSIRNIPTIAVLLASLSGCLATGPEFTYANPADSGMTIYVYRKADLVNSALSPEIFVDAHRIGTMTNGGYFSVKLPSGPHTVRLQKSGWTGESSVETAGHAGESVFIRTDTNYLPGVRTFRLVLIPKDAAMPEISKTRNVANVDFTAP